MRHRVRPGWTFFPSLDNTDNEYNYAGKKTKTDAVTKC